MTLEQPILISLLAFAVSATSLTISLLSYRRDCSRLRACANVVWQDNTPRPSSPVMRVRITNTGRRPVMILNLVMRAGKSKWWRPIQPPVVSSEIANPLELLEELKRKSLAHQVATKLGEGEILELEFRPDDCDEFVALHEDPTIMATSLQIEDVTGRLYSVKDSSRHLATLLEAWKP